MKFCSISLFACLSVSAMTLQAHVYAIPGESDDGCAVVEQVVQEFSPAVMAAAQVAQTGSALANALIAEGRLDEARVELEKARESASKAVSLSGGDVANFATEFAGIVEGLPLPERVWREVERVVGQLEKQAGPIGKKVGREISRAAKDVEQEAQRVRGNVGREVSRAAVKVKKLFR